MRSVEGEAQDLGAGPLEKRKHRIPPRDRVGKRGVFDFLVL